MTPQAATSRDSKPAPAASRGPRSGIPQQAQGSGEPNPRKHKKKEFSSKGKLFFCARHRSKRLSDPPQARTRSDERRAPSILRQLRETNRRSNTLLRSSVGAAELKRRAATKGMADGATDDPVNGDWRRVVPHAAAGWYRTSAPCPRQGRLPARRTPYRDAVCRAPSRPTGGSPARAGGRYRYSTR